MSKFKHHFYQTALLIAGLLILIGSNDLHARKDDESGTKGAIDAATFEVLMKAQELAEQDQYELAIQQLDTIKESKKLNSYAKSQMWNFYAYIYASQEKYKKSIEYYKKVIAEPDAAEGLKLTSKYTLAQLYFQIEDYDAVIHFMEQWLKEIDKATSTAHIMLAQAYFQKGKLNSALKNLHQAMNMTLAEGKKIDENWYRMEVAIYYEQGDLRNTLKTYEVLAELYPRLRYLKQIAGLLGEFDEDRKRLTTFDAVYLKGGLKKEREILNLAYMYLGQEIPYKAGKIIESSINKGLIKPTPENIETLANVWAQANEHKKAIPALKQAAQLSDKGLLYARLAGVYFDIGEYHAAIKAAKLAEKKGGLKRKANNQMLLGMSYFNIKEYNNALQAFRNAKRSKKKFIDARKWEKYTLSEIERIQALKDSQFKLIKRTEAIIRADGSKSNKIGENLLKEQLEEELEAPQKKSENN